MRRPVLLLFLTIGLILGACSDDDGSSPTTTGPGGTSSTIPGPPMQRFPDVVAVEVERTGDQLLRFDVTVSSPYDSPGRYADAWRVVGPDGTVFGIRQLAHDHAGEQPFTRSLDAVTIPAAVTTVSVEARDLANGWGGDTVEVTLPAG